jgi:predicted  nucleic acid-binding Zn-ribbon protein
MEAITEPTKTTRTRRIKKETSAVTNVDATEARLDTHEQVCAERYRAIEAKFHTVDERMDRIEADIKELQTSSTKNFNEIKAMLSGAKDEKFKTMVTAAATVIVALVGMLGYLLTHLPK